MNFFKLVFMKQVGTLSMPHSSMMTICADTAGLGRHHKMHTTWFSRIQRLAMGMNSPDPSIQAAMDRDDSRTVAMSGIKLVLSPVYGCPLVKPLYQHADKERHCVLEHHGFDPVQVDLDYPVINDQM